MKIIVNAKTRSREQKVERVEQPALDFGETNSNPTVYKVWVKESPVDQKANDAIVRALATYFEIPQSRIRLVSGKTYKKKIFEIDQA